MIRKSEKNFLGIKMEFNILGACSGLGQKLNGLDSTPTLIRQNGFLKILEESKMQYTDLGDIKSCSSTGVWPFLSQLKNKISQHLSDQQIMFNLGGDHSIAIGTVAATLEKYPEARVVWVDAHGDINTPASSLTGNLHGMPLAALLGLFKTELNLNLLKKENLILIGVRDLDQFEDDFLKTMKVTVITAAQIKQDPKQALEVITTWLQSKNTPLHLSFDIDSVDPATAPATGLRVADGLNTDFLHSLIQKIAQTKKVLAIDLVELNAQQVQSKSEVESTLAVFMDMLKIFIQTNKQQ